MTYIKRAAETTIARISNMFPVLLVTGPRQVGKTTLLQRLAEEQKSLGIERKYVTLDDPDARYLAKHDPGLFLQRYTPPVLIDEIQYATELLPYIKMSVDRSKKKGDLLPFLCGRLFAAGYSRSGPGCGRDAVLPFYDGCGGPHVETGGI